MRSFSLVVAVVVCAVVVVGGCVSALQPPSKTYEVNVNKVMWEEFKEKFNKKYLTDEEHDNRFNVFVNNMEKAAVMNKEAGEQVYGMTKFSDLTAEEFRATYLMDHSYLNKLIDDRRATARYANLPEYTTLHDLPKEFDWRTKGGVTPVKNQGDCGSCWAFSTTENIESVWHIEGGHLLVPLAVAQIVDCDKVDDGCNGGDLPSAFNYVLKAGGLMSESAYPYHDHDAACNFNPSEITAKIDGWEYVSKDKNETQMQVYIQEKTPIAICVDAESWQSYTGGVIKRGCGKMLDHCVQLVGWGEEKNVPYWIVRNSWGADWGLDGYLYVERNKDECGIGKEPASAYINH
eukprot:m.53562 g.53562  ORF g.53562 m.53562 type:complete len:347 (+) comp11044_c0_seq1:35-1075(+)